MDKQMELSFGCPSCGYMFETMRPESPSFILRCPRCRSRMNIHLTGEREMDVEFRETMLGSLMRLRRA